MTTRLLSLCIWALVAASAAFWALTVLASPKQPPEGVRQVAMQVALNGPLERVLGGAGEPEPDEEEAAAPAASERFALLGVVAPPGQGRQYGGVALLSIDKQPARPWRTGMALTPEWVLQSVSRRAAVIAPKGGSGEAFTLNLPEPSRSPGPALGLPGRGQPMLQIGRPLGQAGQAGQMPPGGAPKPPAAESDDEEE